MGPVTDSNVKRARLPAVPEINNAARDRSGARPGSEQFAGTAGGEVKPREWVQIDLDCPTPWWDLPYLLWIVVRFVFVSEWVDRGREIYWGLRVRGRSGDGVRRG